MTHTTSQTHSETIAGWSPIGPLVSGMGSSVAFTILTGLAERPVFPLPSAFRTCYGPRYLSAQGQSRDLRHVSPMPARCGNSVLRDMAHMGVCPIQANVPHTRDSLSAETPGVSGPSIAGARSNVPPIIDWPRKAAREARSLSIGQAVWRKKSFPGSSYRAGSALLSPWSRGLVKILTYKEKRTN
jgi:hypothetical protein